ncbi:hypothetical protein N0V82_001860 [Gnomoniopsis sp. IMI 355080]|nr:hypothetical protein N0V82_001860 [Gnomoniopsis sp. IMI 355080]
MTTPLASSSPAMSRYFSASASVAVSKVFVGGLSWNINTDQLREHYEKFGDIEEVNIPVNREDGSSRGFGFVVFSDNQADNKTSDDVMQEAISETHNTELDGRTITVNEAQERRPREGGFSRGGGQRRGGGFSRGGGQRREGGYGRGGGRGGYSRGSYGGGGRDNYGGGGRDNYGSDSF